MIAQQQLFLMFAFICLLFFGVLGWVVYLHIQFNKLSLHYTRLLADVEVPDLKSALEHHFDTIGQLTRKVTMISNSQTELVQRMSRVIQKVGLLKYDESGDSGGRQSFLLAMLDEDNSGVLMNSIHSRSGTRVYAKTLSKGIGQHPLSKEEEAVLHLANKGL
ncbi:MAG: DUF4446 family protein [bacterium]